MFKNGIIYFIYLFLCIHYILKEKSGYHTAILDEKYWHHTEKLDEKRGHDTAILDEKC